MIEKNYDVAVIVNKQWSGAFPIFASLAMQISFQQVKQSLQYIIAAH